MKHRYFFIPLFALIFLTACHPFQEEFPIESAKIENECGNADLDYSRMFTGSFMGKEYNWHHGVDHYRGEGSWNVAGDHTQFTPTFFRVPFEENSAEIRIGFGELSEDLFHNPNAFQAFFEAGTQFTDFSEPEKLKISWIVRKDVEIQGAASSSTPIIFTTEGDQENAFLKITSLEDLGNFCKGKNQRFRIGMEFSVNFYDADGELAGTMEEAKLVVETVLLPN